MQKPAAHLGLRHIALYVEELDACRDFYCNILGMQLVWQPDPDNIYLSSGADNLALHRATRPFDKEAPQHLDHLGFFLATPTDVDDWYDFLVAQNVQIVAKPKNHRDGTRSVYCKDPDGNVVQMIYYPIVSAP